MEVAIRQFLWAGTFSTSSESTEIVKVPRALFDRLRIYNIPATKVPPFFALSSFGKK